MKTQNWQEGANPDRSLERQEPLVGNYFVAAYPPFSKWEESQVPALEEALEKRAPARAPLGIYAHIPFCQKKCDYCYYLSYIGQKPEIVNGYLNAMIYELDLYAQRPAVEDREVSFAYFGGGTPSTLTTAQIEMLGNSFRSLLCWKNVREITFECAPRSVRSDFLERLRSIGVNRLSMGVQSFDDELLRLNGRVHLEQDALRAYERIREVEFEVVNLDLMVGLIGETDKKWEESVRRVIELEPDSVTIYQTEIPFNTKLRADLESGSLPAAPIGWEVKRARLDRAFQELERAGYTVVNAYAAVKDPERHRFQYQHDLWGGCDMLGLGVASFGYFDGVHYQNQATLRDYQTPIERGELPLKRAWALSPRDRLTREFVLQLKLGRVDGASFRSKFGIEIKDAFGAALAGFECQGLLEIRGSDVVLSREGLLRVDRLLPDFYDASYRSIRYT